MDAALATNSELCGLLMKDIALFSDGSGGGCDLELTSGPFSAKKRFFFEHPTLESFAESLAAIHQWLAGEARLGLIYEEDHLLFRGDSQGHVYVSGLLIDSGQSLRFEFTTDQTALGPFIVELKKACAGGGIR